MTLCVSCGAWKRETHYVCWACWQQLSTGTKQALQRSDRLAAHRLRDLYRQIVDETPLSEIRVIG